MVEMSELRTDTKVSGRETPFAVASEQLKACASVEEDQSLVPGTHVRWFMASRYSSSGYLRPIY